MRADMMLLHPPIAPWLVLGEAGLELVLLTRDALPAGHVFVRSLPDNEELLTPMRPDGRQGAWHRWRARISWDGALPLTRYCFAVAADDGMHWLAADGAHGHVPTEAMHFRVHRHEQPPPWVRDQVFYQVFPDRFARAGALHRPGLEAWGTVPDPRRGGSALYGGDLPGLTAQLPYLHEELGVTALYLNPVFASPSNHRYDTSDYTQVDALLGGNTALVALRQATRARGMRLVLDAVVNHTGADHAWVQQQPHFYARGADDQPLGWKGHASLPVLDFAQPGVQQAIYGAPDAVLRRWLRPPHDIDGWRLDVIHMLGEGPGAGRNARHVRAIRRAMREEKADAYVLGEHFVEATHWLQGDQEDGAMNYHGFTSPLRGWLLGLPLAGRRQPLSTVQFEAWLTRAVAAIPYANQLAQFNLLDTHDTPRLLTELGGNLALLQLAFTLLFTRPGVPCIYYGDEIGLEGGADPGCRRCFNWDRGQWRMDLWTHVQRLARARHRRAEWRAGATLTLAQGEHWLAYARYDAQAASVVVVNRGPAQAVTLPLHGLPLQLARAVTLDGRPVALTGGELTLSVQAQGSAVVLLG
jgi:alpha-glucosidase